MLKLIYKLLTHLSVSYALHPPSFAHNHCGKISVGDFTNCLSQFMSTVSWTPNQRNPKMRNLINTGRTAEGSFWPLIVYFAHLCTLYTFSDVFSGDVAFFFHFLTQSIGLVDYHIDIAKCSLKNYYWYKFLYWHKKKYTFKRYLKNLLYRNIFTQIFQENICEIHSNVTTD